MKKSLCCCLVSVIIADAATPESHPDCRSRLILIVALHETAKANDIDPFKYILHLCKHIARVETVEDVEALLPWNVKDQLKQRKSTDA